MDIYASMTGSSNKPQEFFYPVKLIVGVLFPDETLWEWTREKLFELWGTPEEESEALLFSVTDYYADISPVLYRRFLSFSGLRDGGELPEWKLAGCAVERASGASRKVNIDPGYINGARLVLASMKDHSHRVYIAKGVHAEVTMRYRFKRWVPFDYTFPDFADGRYDGFFSRVRERWIHEMSVRRMKK